MTDIGYGEESSNYLVVDARLDNPYISLRGTATEWIESMLGALTREDRLEVKDSGITRFLELVVYAGLSDGGETETQRLLTISNAVKATISFDIVRCAWQRIVEKGIPWWIEQWKSGNKSDVYLNLDSDGRSAYIYAMSSLDGKDSQKAALLFGEMVTRLAERSLTFGRIYDGVEMYGEKKQPSLPGRNSIILFSGKDPASAAFALLMVKRLRRKSESLFRCSDSGTTVVMGHRELSDEPGCAIMVRADGDGVGAIGKYASFFRLADEFDGFVGDVN